MKLYFVPLILHTCMFRHLCSPVGSHCLPMVSNLHHIFRPCTTASISWWLSSGDQSTTRWILTSRTDHLDISSKMTPLHSFPLSSNDVRLAAFVLAVDSPCLTNCICLCFESAGRFRFLSTTIHQPTPAGFVMSLP